MVAHAVPGTRRERARAAAFDEIKQTARRLLVSDGVGGVSLRAISREMGMTAPGLYRYYPSLSQLLAALSADLFDELRTYLESVRGAHPPADPGGRLVAVSRAFRRWSVEHPAEFVLVFGTPIADFGLAITPQPAAEPYAAAGRFARVFAGLFDDVWRESPFPITPDHQIDPALRQQLERYRAIRGPDLPLGAVKVFLSCWFRLYGMVALEVFGHLRFALEEAEPMFESEIARIARRLDAPDAGAHRQIPGADTPLKHFVTDIALI